MRFEKTNLKKYGLDIIRGDRMCADNSKYESSSDQQRQRSTNYNIPID